MPFFARTVKFLSTVLAKVVKSVPSDRLMVSAIVKALSLTMNVVYRHSKAMKSEFAPNPLETEFRQVCSRHPYLAEADPKDHSDQPQGSWIKAGLHSLLDFFTGSQTLNIVQRSHADGTVQWIVHDPDAKHPRIFDSEQAVRVWLEQRYYQ